MTSKRESEIASLERNIATGTAQSIIESCGQPDPFDQDRWYNIEHDGLEGDEKADVDTAVRYLELRVLLRRDLSNPHRVCLADKRTNERNNTNGPY